MTTTTLVKGPEGGCVMVALYMIESNTSVSCFLPSFLPSVDESALSVNCREIRLSLHCAFFCILNIY